MALPLRLLGRVGGGRRGRLPPPLAALAHLPASEHQKPNHQLLAPTPPLPLALCVLPFALPARSFSWYSRSPSGTAADAEAPLEEETRMDKEGFDLDGASTVDYGEGPVGAEGGVAGGAADAAVEMATSGDGGGLSGLSVGALSDLLDGVHSITGLPWWMTISFSTVAMRLLIFPVLTLQMKKAAKIGEIFPKLPPPFPPPQSGRSFRDQYSLFQKKKRELGCPSFLWNFAYVSVQLPCFILWMSTIRSMCLSNHPGFDNGGILWYTNLTEFPHGALGPVFPILVSGLHYLNIQISFQNSQIKHVPGFFGLLSKYYKLYLDILTIPLFLIGYVVPQGSLVYWSTNGLCTLAQQLFLINNGARKMLGLPKITAPVVNTLQKSPLEGQKMTQQWPLKDSHMQTKLISSDNGTARENTTPNFMFESGTIVEGNVSESSSPEELLEQALQYLDTGRGDQAIPFIITAIEKNPKLSTTLLGMGQALYSKKLFPEATVCFEHAIPKFEEHDPLLVFAHFTAGVSRIMQGDKETAIKLLQRIPELKEPEETINKACYYQGLVTLGSLLYEEGRNLEAAKYLRLAAAYDPGVERLLKECEDAIEDKPKSANQ